MNAARAAAGLCLLGAIGCSTEPEAIYLDRIVISIAPVTSTLMVNDSALVSAQGFSNIDVVYPIGLVTWRSTDTTVLRVSQDGLVVGRGLGSALIIAEASGKAESLALSVAGTLHSGSVTTSQVWTLTDAPHAVRGLVAVGAPGGATLTVDAGVTVLFEPGAALTFGVNGSGSLAAVGTPPAPVVFRGAGTTAPGSWIGLTFLGPSGSDLRQVRMQGCGGARTDGLPRACVVVGSPYQSSSPTILINSVSMDSGGGAGLALLGEARFVAGSADFSIQGARGPVAIMPASEAPAFPLGGTFTGVDSAEVRLTTDTIRTSSTWPAPGVPWTVTGPVLVEGPASPMLTIPAGRTVRFAWGAGFQVGRNAAGGMVIGAAASAATQLGAVDAGGWSGIVFFPSALPSTIAGTSLDRCGSASPSGYGNGCVLVVGDFGTRAPQVTVTDVTITRAVDVGVGLVGGGRFAPGSANISIAQTGGTIGAPVSINGPGVASLPSGHYAGNALDRILVFATEIVTSETWANHAIPYRLLAGLSVEHTGGPVLTLDPAVVLEFAPGGILRVGGLAPGGLRAVGTIPNPILLTDQTGQAGGWMGVEIGPLADPATQFDHVTVANAGASDGVVAAGIRIAKDYGPIFTNGFVMTSGGCGITRLPPGPWTTDFTNPALGNTFANNAGPAQCGP